LRQQKKPERLRARIALPVPAYFASPHPAIFEKPADSDFSNWR
jgi:hypothetical protein